MIHIQKIFSIVMQAKGNSNRLLQYVRKNISPRRTLRIGQSCEEVDCCGKPLQPTFPQDTVVEKECCPNYFERWTPKIPSLCAAPKKVAKTCNRPKVCVAGMKETVRCIKDEKKAAEECFKRFAPGNVPRKPQEKKAMHRLAQKATSEAKKKKKEEFCMPISDWDHNGHLE
ncbi:unnamed protein product [Callosobruchus maculatus]|uniref:Uncharacterized protein n=1 Tax=Callosobruchus maculatus TaxID=64391 RepID=A0A653DLV7_CALMS|nr:unnamed protein product [Callosobruchus maculatus]